jgi:putative ABC transport system substrate-binding protein
MRRRDLIHLIGSAAILPLAARAQPAPAPVIGYLSTRSPEAEKPLRVPFIETLEKAGFTVGQNIAIEYRYAYGREARLPALAAELVAQDVRVLTAFGRGTALAAKAATSDIPIVFASGFDPISDGLVASLSRPSGNATGISLFTTELGPKRLALLREVLPRPGTIAFIVDPNNSTTSIQLAEVRKATSVLGQSLLVVEATTEDQLAKEFATMADRNIVGALFGAGQYFQVIAEQIVALAAKHRIPTMYEWRDFVTVGGLMSYSTDRSEFARQAAIYVARILKGDRPEDLPVVQSTRFELVVNLKTAKALGLNLPPTLLARANEVIE